MKEDLACFDISFSKLKNDRAGISLGNEKLFVAVEYERGEQKGKPVDVWKLQLLDLEEGVNASKEIQLNDLTDLRISSKMTRGLRAVLKARYKNWENVIEMILIQIDENETVWKSEETEEKETKEVTETQAEQEESADLTTLFSDFCDDKGIFKPALVAKLLSVNMHFKADRRTEILYHYDGKSWNDNGEVHLQELLTQILGEENKQSRYNDILHDLKGLVYEDVAFSRKIALENGLLDLENANIKLEPFSPEEMPFHSLPTTYDKDAKCPSWEEFIKQVVNPDDIATLQEWSGYLLLPDYRFHKLLWVHGAGRNGKGVWQRTMEAILGEDNISSVGLEELDGSHRFALRQLYGSLFNPCSEPAINKILQTPLLKKATGQDTIDAEIKGKQKRLKFRNYAKITVIANRFPRVQDTTVAFKERRLFIKFPNEYLDSNGTQIPNLENVWLNNPQEKSGILNWMLDGLKRLLAQGHFTQSKTQQETEMEFQKASDSISAFLTEMGVFNRILVTTRSKAFDSYKNYCDVFGLFAESEKKFTVRLKETPKIAVGMVTNPRERAWKGLGLNAIDDDGKVIRCTGNTPNTAFPPLTTFPSQKVVESVTHVFPVFPVYSKSKTNILSEEKLLSSKAGTSGIKQEGEPYFLQCCFCGENVDALDAVYSSFTENKPAHKTCYDNKKAQLKGVS
jgi:P4 family phage/plasmid primase-like protien